MYKASRYNTKQALSEINRPEGYEVNVSTTGLSNMSIAKTMCFISLLVKNQSKDSQKIKVYET